MNLYQVLGYIKLRLAFVRNYHLSLKTILSKKFSSKTGVVLVTPETLACLMDCYRHGEHMWPKDSDR